MTDVRPGAGASNDDSALIDGIKAKAVFNTSFVGDLAGTPVIKLAMTHSCKQLRTLFQPFRHH